MSSAAADSAARPRVMCDPIRLAGLTERLEQEVTLVTWQSEPPASYADVAGIFTYGHPLVNGAMLDRLPGVRIISNFGVGYDHIDVAAAAARGVRVANTPGVLDGATADLGLTLLLAAARRLPAAWRYYDRWLPESAPAGALTAIHAMAATPSNSAGSSPTSPTSSEPLRLGSDLAGKTLGILGMGRIGSQVAQRAQGFQLRLIYHNRRPVAELPVPGLEYVTLAELLRQSDFLILTLPLTAATERLLDRAALAQLRPTATLINIARGAIVDTDALVEALQTKRLAYAALDVTEPEPLPADHPLRSLDNVLITPHIGSATQETRQAMGEMAVRNLLLGLQDQALLSEVHPH